MRRIYGIPESFGACAPKGARWVIRENDYDQLEWMEEYPHPTLEEVMAKQQELTSAEPMRVLKEIRDWYLQNSDWTQVQDLRQIRGAEWCAAWDKFRQDLRDLPSKVDTSKLFFDEFNTLQGYTLPIAPDLK